MPIDRSTLLFFDASALIAAAGSPSGGSGFLLSVCEKGFLRAAVSQPVLIEADRNVRENMNEAALSRFHELLRIVPFELAAIPLRRDRAGNASIVGEKDEHVLAASVACAANFLISLDRPLVDAIKRAALDVQAVLPGEFIREYLPAHPDFPSVR